MDLSHLSTSYLAFLPCYLPVRSLAEHGTHQQFVWWHRSWLGLLYILFLSFQLLPFFCSIFFLLNGDGVMTRSFNPQSFFCCCPGVYIYVFTSCLRVTRFRSGVWARRHSCEEVTVAVGLVKKESCVLLNGLGTQHTAKQSLMKITGGQPPHPSPTCSS